jgi:hypothetical protein
MTQSTFPVREKLDQIAKKAVDDGRIPKDAASAGAAALIPSFSKQTLPLDDNGQAIETRKPPPFADGHVDLPAATETTGAAPSSATPAAAAPAAPAATPAASAPAAAGTAEAPGAAATGAAAAEAVAAAIEEMAEFNFRDPDLDIDIPIRVPKKYEETVKRGYGRRTDIDRTRTYLKEAEPTLRPLIEDGRLRRIMPILQRATEDEEFARYISAGYDRRIAGLPMVQEAVREITATAPPAPAAPEFVDPFVDPQLVDLRTRTEANERYLTELRQREERQQQSQRQRDEQVRRNNAAMVAAHQDLARMYPGVYRPELTDKDPAWASTWDYARQSGYFESFSDLRAALIFGGQGWRALEAERAAATQSPAASALAAMDTRLLDAATREARDAASTVSGGSVATSTMPAPPAKPSTTGPDGKLKDHGQYMNEVLAWERAYGRLKGA